MRLFLALPIALALGMFVTGCDDDKDSDPTGGGGQGGAVVVTSGCAQCEPGKECCDTWGEPGCVDTDSNPNHCGQCDNPCGNQEVCQSGSCATGEDCSDAGTCTDGECCQPMGICCPTGTGCVSSVPDFMGCCPVGDVCTCSGQDCPISRRQYKQNVEYLSEPQLTALRDELLRMRLATYRYRSAADPHTHLGFILEDVEPSVAADSSRGRVDLYSYASMAVATVQLQAKELETLRRDVAALRKEVAALRK
jgi:hypothetical protein